LKAIVAGAGIAGLATAIGLRQAGLDVEIFERSPVLREIGAGLMIWPNGARSLQALGVEVNSLAVRRLSVCTWRGRRLNDYPLDSIAARYGLPPSFVHRADLQSALAAGLGARGLNLGAEVTGFRNNAAGVEVTLRDGTSVTGDLLVGADGLRSSVRRQLLAEGEPIYLGSTIWRGVVDASDMGLEAGTGVNWIGRGAEFLAFHLPDHRIYWAGVTREPRGERAGPGGHKDDLARRFDRWVQPVPRLIAATDESAILRNDMFDRKPVHRWSAERVTLVGDAAHPMTPNAGQGACQALEDAVALRDSLRRSSEAADAFALYERQRLRRANRVVAMSRQATRAVQFENPLLCAVRDNVAYRVAERAFLWTLDGILAPPRQ